MTGDEKHQYRVSLSLNVLNHLGLNLYSNVPAVLSEVVANSWDADATQVLINLDASLNQIRVEDDGHGMSQADCNEKYLLVGYQRRKDGRSRTPEFDRPVMGRKGIGKLSLFSIADTIKVESVKDGLACGFVMDRKSIEETYRVAEEPSEQLEANAEEPQQVQGEPTRSVGVGEISGESTYYPEALDPNSIDLEKGTRITLTDLKRSGWREAALRQRLARRFSVIGPSHNFSVKVNDEEISASDRGYFKKLQYIWCYGAESKHYADACSNLADNGSEVRQARLEAGVGPGQIGSDPCVSGWLGTVAVPNDLTGAEGENLNSIVIIVRGKLAHEDALAVIKPSGVFASYITGEIHADFLDADGEDDIATTNRQRVREDDPRFERLLSFLRAELKHIERRWSDLRNQAGARRAQEIPVIKTWYRSLTPDNKKAAKALFGRINRLAVGDDARRELFKNAVVAFEGLRYRENLGALESVSLENLDVLASVFGTADELEATFYHQIVRQRLEIIRKLHSHIQSNSLEKVVQEYLFDHLWLLDPSWERATSGTPLMETTIKTEWGKITAKLTDDEASGRRDIKYRTAAGKHIVVELKRATVKTDTYTLMRQVDKYRTALMKVLESVGKADEPVEGVCVVGVPLSDWDTPRGLEESRKLFATKNMRVVMYRQLIDEAFGAYQAFLDQSKEAGRIVEMLLAIEGS